MSQNINEGPVLPLTHVIGHDADGYGGRIPSKWLAMRELFSAQRELIGYRDTAPTVTINTTSSTLNANTAGAVTVGAASDLLNYGIDRLVNVSGSLYEVVNVTSTLGVFGGDAMRRLRFMTDEPAFEFAIGYLQYANVNMIVEEDGVRRIASPAHPIYLSNTGTSKYIKFNFGANAYTYSAVTASYGYFTVFAAGGNGYAVGDEITLSGGTAVSPVVLVVTSVSSGAVYTAMLKDSGSYSANPYSGGVIFSQASTTGSGTGFQIAATAMAWQTVASTRKMRGIELWWTGSLRHYGINVASGGVVLPYPVSKTLPRVVFVGDSQSSNTYLQTTCGGLASKIAQMLGVSESYAVSAQGGTGWNRDNGTSARWSNAYRLADLVAYNPDLVVFIGSQNDTQDAALQAAITGALNSLCASLPECLFVGIGSVVSTSSDYTKAGWEDAAGYGKRCAYIDNVTPPWISTNNSALALMASDANHLSPNGRDLFAKSAAEHIAKAVLSLAA